MKSINRYDYENAEQTLGVMPKNYPDGFVVEPHSHERGQLIHATSGLMKITTAKGLWLVPPQHALSMPPRLERDMVCCGPVTLRTLYVRGDALPTSFPAEPKAVGVSPFLRELIRAQGEKPAMIRLMGEAASDAVYRSQEAVDWYTAAYRHAPGARPEITLRSVEYARAYNPGDYVGQISPTSLLIQVAERDDITPTDLALEVYNCALEPKSLRIIPGAGHFGIYIRDFESASAAALQWFERYLGRPGSSDRSPAEGSCSRDDGHHDCGQDDAEQQGCVAGVNGHLLLRRMAMGRRGIAAEPGTMTGQHQAEQPEEEIVEHLIDRRPFLQDVVPDQKARHEGEPAMDCQPLVAMAEEGAAKADFDERDGLQVGVHQGRRQPDAQVALEESGVVGGEPAMAEKLARSGSEQDEHHHRPDDALRILQGGDADDRLGHGTQAVLSGCRRKATARRFQPLMAMTAKARSTSSFSENCRRASW